MNSTSHIQVVRSCLMGNVHVSGAKNSALRLLAASLLTEESVELHNFPLRILDADIHLKMLKKLGKAYTTTTNSVIITEDKNLLCQELLWNDRSIRNTLLILGVLNSRFGFGKVPLPGGCKLGERKYDLHTMILEKMGARTWEENNYLCAEVSGRLKGCDIHLPIRSTGATENALLSATLAIGQTTIWNPHIRPEIIDMIEMLRKMGADIKVFGQMCIKVNGIEALHGVKHTVIPDNMEAITWAIASVITGGDVEIINFPFEHLEVPLIYLRESGMKYYIGKNSIVVKGGKPFPVDISTGPYPGINSDMQPLFAVYGACSEGESKIIDLRFPGRYGYAEELQKMGMDFSIKGDLLSIHGKTKFIGTRVKALDLRAGMALVLAGLVADGKTFIEDAWQIERGYEDFVVKLKSIEGNIV